MTDERLERALSDAIADLAGTSAPDYLSDILARTSRTRQRPWWTFPRRYLSMSPTVKFAAAAGLAFVLGIGVAPFVMPGDDRPAVGPPGAESPTPSAAPVSPPSADPVAFTGFMAFGECLPATTEVIGDITRTSVTCYPPVFGMSDDRLLGDGTIFATSDSIGDEVTLWNGAFRIENDAGAWQESPASLTFAAFGEPTSTTTIILVGEGAYEGLVAVTELTLDDAQSLWSLRGVILEGGIPPAPELPGSE